jgi:hypothetical protein
MDLLNLASLNRFLTTPQSRENKKLIHEPSWRELVEEIDRLRQSSAPLRADWFAFAASEGYGIWLFRLDGSVNEDSLAAFTLFAARAIEKAGIKPVPIPQPSEHDPLWRRYCELEEERARRQGKVVDLSNAVPYGLGDIDRDAVDPCTRAWLEELRRDGTEFQSSEGSFRINGQESRSFDGFFADVCKASSIYCKRRGRNEIGARLFRGAGEREKTAHEGGPESNTQATHLSSPGESLPPEKVVAGRTADNDRDAGIAEGCRDPESATSNEMADIPKPKTDENAVEGSAGKRRGRRPNTKRHDAINVAMTKHGDQWRNHLPKIFAELDDQAASLGDFEGMKIDLGDGESTLAEKWMDLDLAEGNQRRRIVDTLRKYV